MDRRTQREPQWIAQLLILESYTALVLGLVAETLLMSWELWAIPLILGGVAASWLVHIRQKMTGHQRIWVYTILMMGTFFFYGIHVTSTYDMALLMMIVIIIYTVAGERKLVTFCQITYYVTLAYDLGVMIQSGTTWDSLLISRTILHVVLMYMAGWLAKYIIREWEQILKESDAQIADLDKTTKRMNAFMSNISHELRTPINAIMGTTEIVLDQENDDWEKTQLLTIQKAASRMAMQVGDIMDYSELQTGRLVVNSEPYTLASLFNDVFMELRSHISPEVEVIVDVDAQTPSGMISDVRKLRRILFHLIGNSLKFTRQGGVYVHVTSVKQDYGINLCVEVSDTGIGMKESETRQILQRFYQTDTGKTVSAGGLGLGLPIANGFVRALGGFLMIESEPDRGTSVRISLPQKVSDERSCMSVADKERINLGGYLNIGKFSNPYVREYYDRMILGIVQGLGTPMHRVDNLEDLKKLLERVNITHLFLGAEEYLSSPAYMEALTDTMKVIVVASDTFLLPEGSKAWVIYKPFSGFAIVNVLNAGETAGNAADSRLYYPDVHALVVDDELMNLTVAASILKKYGMHVTTVSSGKEAIAHCRESHFDIVFMDHMMPEMDGVEAMKQIRAISDGALAPLPVIALTANALSSAREMFLEEGFDGFVSKPIEIPELERVLKRVLSSSGGKPISDPDTARPAAGGKDEELRILTEAGISTTEGRRYCQQDDELYFSLLYQFADDFSEKKEKLDRYLIQKDCDNYRIVVHALKSTAKTIGAAKLSDTAKELETAAKSGDFAFLQKRHSTLMNDYQETVSAIQSLRKNDAFKEPELLTTDGILQFFPQEERYGGTNEGMAE